MSELGHARLPDMRRADPAGPIDDTTQFVERKRRVRELLFTDGEWDTAGMMLK